MCRCAHEETYGSPIWTPSFGDRAFYRVHSQNECFEVSRRAQESGAKNQPVWGRCPNPSGAIARASGSGGALFRTSRSAFRGCSTGFCQSVQPSRRRRSSLAST
jgi:acetoin utilization deacetylase AcuC-like enzyme